METDSKDYAFRNEISLSIGDSSPESTAASTPSTVSPASEPKPSPRQQPNASDDSKLLNSSAGDKSSYEMAGIDNRAFESNDKMSKKTSEAVNLELMNNNNNNNMSKQPNSSTKNGKEMESKNDSFEEYFVPVNEHRKYMRWEFDQIEEAEDFFRQLFLTFPVCDL